MAIVSLALGGAERSSPNAVLEAMSAGIAVIANASGGTGELGSSDRGPSSTDGSTGRLMAEDCAAAALAQAISVGKR